MRTTILCLSLLFTSLVWALPSESLLQYEGNTFSYYSSHNLFAPNTDIEEVVIVIHGSERNADTYYKSMEALSKKAGKEKSTLVIAPHFKLKSDVLKPMELTYTDEGWLRGDTATNAANISSFLVMDYFIVLATNPANFPHVKKITITGHSAGGQLTQRYAVGTNLEQIFTHLKFHYVVLNPGSYVYLSKKRLVQDPEVCAYNNYKYGLENLNPYMNANPKNMMITRYLKRNVTYMVGELDNIAEGIDQDCPARYQGKTRLERATLFKKYLDQEFQIHEHELYVVPKVGHTQHGMYQSELGLKVIFAGE